MLLFLLCLRRQRRERGFVIYSLRNVSLKPTLICGCLTHIKHLSSFGEFQGLESSELLISQIFSFSALGI
jgi:hypothetical protein